MINTNLLSQVLVKVAVKELVWLESVYCIVDAFIVIKIDWLFWYYDVEKKWNLEKQLRVRLWKKAMPKEKHYHNFTWKRKNEVSFSLGNCRPSRVVFHCKWLMYLLWKDVSPVHRASTGLSCLRLTPFFLFKAHMRSAHNAQGSTSLNKCYQIYITQKY